uniref:Uncharacterized protein n=1 Tax=viral metagenome TaxID=1070528 RepID=A0A6C0HIT4_9ZZZZ
MENPGAEGVEHECEMDSDKALVFSKIEIGQYGYLINYADGASGGKSETRKILNKMNPLLDCGDVDDIFGSRPGIYTWILCSLENKFVIFFKRTIIANEIRSKHNDILEDVCRDTFDKREIKELQVYYGGEAKITESIKGRHFTLNMLSGSYSQGVVDIDPSDIVKSFLTNFIKKQNQDSEVSFDKSGKTFITNEAGSDTKITEEKLMGLMKEGVGLEVFKFPIDSDLWKKISKPGQRSNIVLKAMLFTKIEAFERQNKLIDPTEEDLKRQKDELDKLQPVPDEIMNQYRLMPEPDDEYYSPKRKKSKKLKHFKNKRSTRNKHPQKVNRRKLARLFRFT